MSKRASSALLLAVLMGQVPHAMPGGGQLPPGPGLGGLGSCAFGLPPGVICDALRMRGGGAAARGTVAPDGNGKTRKRGARAEDGDKAKRGIAQSRTGSGADRGTLAEEPRTKKQKAVGAARRKNAPVTAEAIRCYSARTSLLFFVPTTPGVRSMGELPQDPDEQSSWPRVPWDRFGK